MMNTRKKAERASIDSVKDAIKKKGGKSDKVIMALLDMDTLRDSKSRDADIDSALNTLFKESVYLFNSEEPIKNPTTTIGSAGGTDSMLAAMRVEAGLPPEKK